MAAKEECTLYSVHQRIYISDRRVSPPHGGIYGAAQRGEID